MRLKVVASAAFLVVGLGGCETVGFMTTPNMLVSRDRAQCRAMSDYLERSRCLARCWERQQMIWAEQSQRDRDLRTPVSLADDPMLADALYGG